jgi:hypothetical protein
MAALARVTRSAVSACRSIRRSVRTMAAVSLVARTTPSTALTPSSARPSQSRRLLYVAPTCRAICPPRPLSRWASSASVSRGATLRRPAAVTDEKGTTAEVGNSRRRRHPTSPFPFPAPIFFPHQKIPHSELRFFGLYMLAVVPGLIPAACLTASSLSLLSPSTTPTHPLASSSPCYTGYLHLARAKREPSRGASDERF